MSAILFVKILLVIAYLCFTYVLAFLLINIHSSFFFSWETWQKIIAMLTYSFISYMFCEMTNYLYLNVFKQLSLL